MVICVSICANYLPKAMVLAKSVKEHIPDAIFVVCLVEKYLLEDAAKFTHFDECILAKDLGWDNFDAFIFKHSIVEASTAVKGRLLLHLMDRFQSEDIFIYLDPDVKVYGNFVELQELMQEHTLVLAPHLLRPGNIEMEISSLAHGCYNLGFIALRRSDNAQAFLSWWTERLFSFCYDDKSKGLFTDQRWVDLAPCFFDVHVLKHHGYDFATWSLMGCELVKKQEDILVNGDLLRFIHFSGFDNGTIDAVMSRWMDDDENRTIFTDLYKGYASDLQAHDEKQLSKTPWSYAAYENGEIIDSKARKRYREHDIQKKYPSPFRERNITFLAASSPGDKKSFLELVYTTPRYLRTHGVTKTLFAIKNKLVEILHAKSHC